MSKLVGSAKNGVISKEDVMVALKEGRISSSTSSSSAPSLHQPQHLNAVKPPSPSPSSPASSSSPSPAPVQSSPANAPINSKYVDVPCSNMRKVIAKRLTQSKAQVPHFYSTIDCEIDAMLAFRAKLKKDFGINVSVNDLVIKAAALALRDVPEANSQLRGGGAGKLKLDKKVDISVAVATPSGLITPIVTDADQRGLSSINAAVKDLATRARDGKLKPEEYQGGSFTISNLGTPWKHVELTNIMHCS